MTNTELEVDVDTKLDIDTIHKIIELLKTRNLKQLSNWLPSLSNQQLIEFLTAEGIWEDASGSHHSGIISLVLLSKDKHWEDLLASLLTKLTDEEKTRVVSHCDEDQNNPIHFTVISAGDSVARLLLSNVSFSPANLKKLLLQPNVERDNALHLAAKRNSENLVRYFVKCLWEVDKGNTLYEALKQENDDRLNPLHLAVRSSTADVVTLLLEKLSMEQRREVILQKLVSPDEQKCNSLHEAIELNHPEVVAAIINGLESNILEKILVDQNSDLDSAVHLAFKHRRKDILKIFLRPLNFNGLVTCLTEPNRTGSSVLELIIVSYDDSMLQTCIELLQETESLPSKRIEHSKLMLEALALAISKSNVEAVKPLIDAFAQDKQVLVQKANTKIDQDGNNFVQLAVKHGNMAVLEQMHSYLAMEGLLWDEAILFQNSDGNNSLHLAVMHRNVAGLNFIKKSLLKIKVWVDALKQENSMGNNVLHQVAMCSNKQIVGTVLSIQDKQGRIEVAETPEGAEERGVAVSPDEERDLIMTTNHNGDCAIRLAALSRNAYAMDALLQSLRQSPEALLNAFRLHNFKKDTIIHLAIKLKNQKVLKILLDALQQLPKENNIEILCSQRNREGYNAINYAVVQGNKAILTSLIPLIGVDDLKAKTDSGLNCLQVAILNGKVEAADSILRSLDAAERWELVLDEDKNSQNSLQIASKLRTDVGKLNLNLFEGILRGLHPERGCKSVTGDSAMHLAARFGSERVVKVLLDASADKFNAINQKNEGGKNVFQVAVAHGNRDAWETMLGVLNEEEHKLLIEQQDAEGNNALHLSANDLHSLQLLLNYVGSESKGRLLQLVNKTGDNLLCLCVNSQALECVTFIISQMKEQDLVNVIENPDGNSVLPIAAKVSKDERILAILVEHVKASQQKLRLMKKKDENGNTVAHIAAQQQNENMLGVIFKAIPETNREDIVLLKNNLGNTVLALGIRSEKKEVVEMLLDLINEKNVFPHLLQKNTASNNMFHIAAVSGNVEVIRMLLERLEEEYQMQALQELNNKGYSVLQTAVCQKKSSTVEALLTPLPAEGKFSLITQMNRNKLNAMQMAAEENSSAILESLVRSLPAEFREKALIDKKTGENIIHHLKSTGKSHMLVKLIKLLPQGNTTGLDIQSYQEKMQAFVPELRRIPEAFYTSLLYRSKPVVEVLLNMLSPEERMHILYEVRGNGNNIFHVMSKLRNDEMIELFLESLTQEQRVQVICSTNNDGHSSIRLASRMNMDIMVQALVQVLPPSWTDKIMEELDMLNEADMLGRPTTTQEFYLVHVLLKNLSFQQAVSHVAHQLWLCATEECKERYGLIAKRLATVLDLKEINLTEYKDRCQNALHHALKKKDPKMISVLLEHISLRDIEIMLRQKNNDGFYAVEMAIRHSDHQTLQKLFEMLEPAVIKDVVLATNIRQVNALEIAKELWPEKESLFDDMPEIKHESVQLLLMQHAVESEDHKLLKFFCDNHGQELRYNIPSLVETFSMSSQQINVLSRFSDAYLIPFNQQKAKKHSYIFYEATGYNCREEAVKLHAALNSLEFHPELVEWSGTSSVEIDALISNQTLDSSSVLLVAFIGSCDVTELINLTLKRLENQPLLPVIFLLQLEGYCKENVESGILRRPHTVFMKAGGQTGLTKPSFLDAIVTELKSLNGENDIMAMYASANAQFGRPSIRFGSTLEKRLVLPCSQVVADESAQHAVEDEDSIMEFLKSCVTKRDYEPVPRRLVELIHERCKEYKLKQVVVSQSTEDWRSVIVLIGNPDDLEVNFSDILEQYPAFQDNLIVESQDSPVHSDSDQWEGRLTVTKKIKNRSDPAWNVVARTVRCELIVSTTRNNTAGRQRVGTHYAVVPAHLILTGEQKRTAAEPCEQLRNMMEERFQVEPQRIQQANDAGNEGVNVSLESAVIAQMRLEVEKLTSRHMYFIKISRSTRSFDLKLPPLFCYRERFFRTRQPVYAGRQEPANYDRCPAGQCDFTEGKRACFHEFLNDIALLPLEAADAGELQRILAATEQPNPRLPIMNISWSANLDYIYENRCNIMVREYNGTVYTPVYTYQPAEDEDPNGRRERGIYITFILDPPHVLHRGDCGAIVYLVSKKPAYSPLAMYVGKDRYSTTSTGEQTKYKAIVLAPAFRNIEADYPHHVNRLQLFH